VTQLTAFRDHCRRMAKANQKPSGDPGAGRLWTALADEADAYLNGHLTEDLDLRALDRTPTADDQPLTLEA
jgi:hypothetical protein